MGLSGFAACAASRAAAEAHACDLFNDNDQRPSDSVLGDYVESTEYIGDGSWFAGY